MATEKTTKCKITLPISRDKQTDVTCILNGKVYKIQRGVDQKCLIRPRKDKKKNVRK